MKPWPETIALSRPLRNVRSPDSALVEPAPAISKEQLDAAYQRGRIDGEKALSEQLLRQRAGLHELMQGVVVSLRDAVPRVMRDSESLMISLALEVAQKLVAEMPVSVAMVEAAVRDALGHIEGTAEFTVRLHPADLELLRQVDSPVLQPQNDSQDFRFLSSPEVSRGGCMVQTRFGTVDARRETKFDLLSRNLLAC